MLVIVTGMFAMQLHGVRAQRDTADGARHAEQVLRVSNGLERRVVDLETGLRGYLLTGRESFLGPYFEARASDPAPRWRSCARSRASRRRSTARPRLDGLIETTCAPTPRRCAPTAP